MPFGHHNAIFNTEKELAGFFIEYIELPRSVPCNPMAYFDSTMLQCIELSIGINNSNHKQ